MPEAEDFKVGETCGWEEDDWLCCWELAARMKRLAGYTGYLNGLNIVHAFALTLRCLWVVVRNGQTVFVLQ